MKKLTPAQIDLFAAVEQSIPKVSALADKARSARLFIVEGFLRHMVKDLRDSLDLQTRSFRDDTLVDHEPLFPHGRFPYGRKDSPND